MNHNTNGKQEVRMRLDREQKEKLKRDVAECLKRDKEVQRVVVFGSFLTSDDPHDMDIAVFQSSPESYLPLALKYRRQVRAVAKQIAVDVIPIRPNPAPSTFLTEVEHGEVVYER